MRPTVYPTPVWGTAGVPGCGAGPFVPSGYKWTARTTELHPDGECKHRPPQGETPGEGTPSDDKDPPPTHQSREGPGTAPGEHRPKRRGKETEGGEHAKGAAGGHTTNRPQPGGAGNHTAKTGEGPLHTAPTPTQSRQTKPRKARTGTQTHHQHTAYTPAHAHNTHHHTCTQQTRAPQTHTTHQSASTARTTNARNTRKFKEQEPSNPPPEELQNR